MFDKPHEYWAAFVGMLVYIFMRDRKTETLAASVGRTIASALLTLALSPTAAAYTRGNEILAAVGLMAFILIALDVGTALFSDREFVKELIRKKFGGGNGQD